MINVNLDKKAKATVSKTANIGGGTTVIANPELSGDEPKLSGLEVNGNKFKVPEPKEYFAGNGIVISEEGMISLDIAVADEEEF